MATPQERIAQLMQDYDVTSSDSDEIAQTIAADPDLVAALTPNQRRLLVLGLFDGDTGEDEEDAAMVILRGATVADLKWIINQIGWADLDKELDDEDMAELRGRSGDLTGFDPTDADADEVAEIIANNPALLATMSVHSKVLLVQALFIGTTGEGQEDAAMTILLSMSAAELQSAINQIGWSDLDSELDDEDIALLRGRTGDLTGFDPTDDDSDDIAMAFASDPNILTQLDGSQRALLVKALFDGPTDEAEEDAAVTVLLSEPTGEGLVQLICDAGGWEKLDSELDTEVLDQIARACADRLDTQWAPLRGVMPWLYLPNLSLFLNPASDSVQAMINNTPAVSQIAMIDTALARRMSLLTRVGSLRRRGKFFPADVLFQGLAWLSQATQHKVPECLQLRHEVRYLNNLAQDLANANYEPLLSVLADLVDASLPVEQRLALFEMLRWLEPEHEAQRQAVDLLGSADQKARMLRFMNVRRAALNAFDPALPADTVLAAILKALNDLGEAVSGGLSELRTLLTAVAGDVVGALSLSAILGTDDDDNARSLIALLGSLQQDGTSILAHLPFATKQKLLDACLTGSTGDDDEIAINSVFNATDEMDRAELFQLMAAVTYESLSGSIDGDEWDSFLALLACGANRLGTAQGALVTLKESRSGANILFRNTWTGRVLATDEACSAIRRGEVRGYTVHQRGGRAFPVSAPDASKLNNLAKPVRSRLLAH